MTTLGLLYRLFQINNILDMVLPVSEHFDPITTVSVA
mgnify:CR=1 FL=1